MRLTLAALLLMASAPAWAGDPTSASPPSHDPASPAPMAPGVPAIPYATLYDAPLFGHPAPAIDRVDEAALRFYAAQKNRQRVDAEIKRLHALHPAWTVPTNLYADGSGNDEQPLWDLFAAGQIEQLHVAIQAREMREPGWRPSADLLAKTDRQEAATAIKTLSDAKDWSGLLTLAAAHPDVLSCSTIDLAWRVADAFVASGSPKRAYEVDAAILKSCKDREERLATVRKAVDVLTGGDVEQLIASGDVLADGSGEFDGIRLDLARRQIGIALATVAGKTAEDVPASSLAALGSATLRSGDSRDAAILGWYAFRGGRWAEADGWFKLGLAASSGDVKLAEGHALALKELGRLVEAEQLAHVWRERSGALRNLFVTLMTDRLGGSDAAAIDAAELADFNAVLMADRSVLAAGALGWVAFGHGDLDAASLWFGRAVEWAGTGEIPEKVAEGYALTLKGLGRLDAAEDFLYPRRPGSPALRDLYVAIAIAALPDAAGPGKAGRPTVPVSPERLDRFAEAIRAARSVPGAAAMGWRNLDDGRPIIAVGWFDDAADWSSERPVAVKITEGRVLALKNSGRFAEAEDAAFDRMSDSVQLREAYRGIMLAQLMNPALADKLTAEHVSRFAGFVEAESSAEGAEALGWYRLGGPGCGFGTDWFHRAIAWSADRKGSAKANEGYALALARSGHDLEADDVASAWAGRAPDMKALSIKVLAEALTRDLFPRRLPEDRLDRLATMVWEEHSVSGAQALGWYRYRDAGTGYGVEWFADAIRWSPDRLAEAKTVEGYASALRDVGRLADAEEVLFPFVASVPAMRDLYIDTVVSELTLDNPPEPMPRDRLARFIAVATPQRSAAAAQALGWYRFARHEYPDAAVWFKDAVDWWPALSPDADRFTYEQDGYHPLQARLALNPEDYRRTPRAFASRAHAADAATHRYVDTLGGLATTWTGYALTLRALGRDAEAEDIAFAWRDRWPALGRLFVDLAIEALTRPGGPAITPDRLKRFEAAIEEARDPAAAAALGWAAMSRHDPAEAAVWLKAATDWRPGDAALDGRVAAGYIDALRLSGRGEEAFAAAAAWADKAPEVKAKLFDTAIGILTTASQPAADGTASPIVPEQLVQAMTLADGDPGARGPAALGWYYLGTKQPSLALPVLKLAVTRAGDAAQSLPVTAISEGDAAILPKAVEGYALALRALGRDADALTMLDGWSAKVPTLSALPGDIVVDLLGRAGAQLSPELAIRMAAATQRTQSVKAAAAFGWQAYGNRDWAKAAEWFADGIAWSAEHRGPVKLVEGYAASLHNLCRFRDAEAAALSRPEDDTDGRLRVIYVDTVSDRISRARPGTALTPSDAARFAAATMAIASPNGAQALGWYAYRSHQFAAAAAWFERAVAWRVTEPEVYGLALAYRRLGDAVALEGVLSRFEERFASLAAVRRAGIGGHEPPVPNFGALARSGCADGIPTTRGDIISGAQAPPLHAVAASLKLPDPISSSVQETPPLSSPVPEPASALPRAGTRRPRAPRQPSAPRNVENTPAPVAADGDARCLHSMAQRPARTARDLAAEGWCLLSLQRPAEAARAFRAAGLDSTGKLAGDSALGETLAHLRTGDTGAAVDSASRAAVGVDARQRLGLQILAQEAYDAYAAGRWADTLALLRRRAGFAAETRDLVMLRGWARYQSGDYEAARRAFAEADAELSDHESRKALATVTGATTQKAFR